MPYAGLCVEIYVHMLSEKNWLAGDTMCVEICPLKGNGTELSCLSIKG
jgi:hypothetical protein